MVVAQQNSAPPQVWTSEDAANGLKKWNEHRSAPAQKPELAGPGSLLPNPDLPQRPSITPVNTDWLHSMSRQGEASRVSQDSVDVPPPTTDRFRGKPSGRIEIDAGSSIATDSNAGLGDFSTGPEFRRIRLAYELQYGDKRPAILKVDLGLASGSVRAKDFYLALKDVPLLGLLRAGNLKEPTTLEGTMSSKYLTFMERGLPVATFWPERNLGFSAGRTMASRRATWQLAAFLDDDLGLERDMKLSDQSGHRISGRLTGLPIHRDENRSGQLFHLGMSGTIVTPNNDTIRYASKPESSLAPNLLDTGSILTDRSTIVALEAAYVDGPFSLQTEYIGNWVRQKRGPTAFLSGYYLSGSWLLTGESRSYNRRSGVFEETRPNKNFTFKGGGGAWEIGLRYSHLDLNDSGIAAGQLNDLTGGINWILNPQMRLQFNYVYSSVMEPDSSSNSPTINAHSFQGRWHAHF